MASYQDLLVWQKARILTKDIYQLTKSFPSDEKFGLTSQMRRAVISIPSNLAEGHRRGCRGEWLQFVRYAFGSAAELEAQLILVSDLEMTIFQEKLQICQAETTEILKLLNNLIKSIKNSS